jgi:hypothetical protein
VMATDGPARRPPTAAPTARVPGARGCAASPEPARRPATGVRGACPLPTPSMSLPDAGVLLDDTYARQQDLHIRAAARPQGLVKLTHS